MVSMLCSYVNMLCYCAVTVNVKVVEYCTAVTHASSKELRLLNMGIT